MSRIRRAAAVLVLALGATGGIALAGTALATGASSHGCATKTVTTHLKDRPDSGEHGDWAKDELLRTVRLCQTSKQAGVGVYHAVLTDQGTFTTVAGKSPQAGKDLPAGIKGTVQGTFTADFTAAADWKTFDASKLDGKTFTGASGPTGAPTTSTWVSTLFSDFKGSAINNDWWWKYETCEHQRGGEKWLNAAKGNHGDITKLCKCQPPTKPPTTPPTATPTATATATPPATVPPATTPPATHPPTTPPVGGGGGGDSYTNGGLAQTGFDVALWSGAGVIILCMGGLLVFLGRRRRTITEA